jgi:hypothetical protein
MKNNRILVVGGILVVAVIAALYATKTFPPRQGVEGAIGAANRYQSEQISEADVALKDPEIQAFLQTDLFHKIATNADFANALKDGDWGKFVTRDDMKSKFGDAALAKVFESDMLMKTGTGDEWKQVASDQAYRTLSENARFQDLLADGGFAGLARKTEFAKAMVDPAVQKALAESDLSTVKAQADFLKQLAPEYAVLKADAALATYLADPAVVRIFQDNNFGKLMTDGALAKALNRDEMKKLRLDPAAARVFFDPAVQRWIEQGKASIYFGADGLMPRMWKDENLKSMVQDANFGRLVTEGALARAVEAVNE